MTADRLLEWLSGRMEDGCTDVTLFRGKDCWQIEFRNVGIPASDPLGTECYRGHTLKEALTEALMGHYRLTRGLPAVR